MLLMLSTFQFAFEAANLAKCHLPFVVIGAVSVATTFLILSSHVNAKVVYGVVSFVPVTMIDALPSFERPAKMLCHVPAMFKNKRCACRCHGSEHRQVFGVEIASPECNVSAARFVASQTFAFSPQQVACSQGSSSTRQAVATKIQSFEKLPQRPERIPAFLSAAWAGDGCAVSRPTVHPDFAICFSDCWMVRQFCPIMWSCHN